MYGESKVETYITICKIIANGNLLMAQKSQTGALYQPRGLGSGGRWEEGSKGRGRMSAYG